MLNTGYILDGKYEILDILGSGGMSTVYLCRNNRLGNLWAIKEVLSEWKDKIDFLAEPNILKNLNHAGIPRIIDIFYENDNLYMVEDYIDGKNLKDLIDKNGCLTFEKIKTIAIQLCNILEYLHSFSPPIIYRDLKPSNIMLKSNGNVVLIDFGIARTYKEYKYNDTLLLGSKGYMAPEQLYNVQSNIQTDIYSLGATLYYLATQKTLESSNDVKALYSNVENYDEKLIQVLDKATAAKPENRFKSMIEFKNMLLENNEAYEKTRYIPASNIKDKTILKTQIMKTCNNKKKLPILIAGSLLLIAVLSTSYFLLNGNNVKKPSAASSSKKANTADVNNGSNSTKAAVDNDIITRGVLYKNSPTMLNDTNSNDNNYDNSDNNNGKGKGKNKNKLNSSGDNFHLLFTLNPVASINNSKINIMLNSIELLNNVSILDLNINNKTNTDINMDLNKTFLLNGNSTTFYPSINNSDSIVVSQNSSQNIKLYFNDFDFQGNSYCFKTTVNYGTYKDVSLFIDVK